jgi:hypothetical protein
MGPPDVVEVSVQGESARKITLTGIDFEVSHRERPVGAIFREPCGGPIVGRALEVDLDASPPRIVESSAETNGLLGSRTASGRPLTRQIRFPWTVSLTDPLLLYVIGTTKACYCEWRAEIPWASGSERGSIQIDDQGQAYRVASGDGLRSYTSTGTRWVGYPPD